MKKLLIVTDEMEVGGSQRQITQILTHIDQSQFEPVLLYFRYPSFLVDQIEAAGVRTIHLPKAGKIDLGFVKNLVALLRRENFHLAHAFSFTGELWINLAIKLARVNTKLLTSIRGKYEWYSPLQWRLKKWVTQNSERVVSNSQEAAEYAFQQMGLASDKLTVVHNGIRQPADQLELPSDLAEERANSPWILTFVGRLVDHKNLPCLLRALKPFEDQVGQDYTVWLVGDGPDRAQLEQQLKALGLTRVRFLGERNDVDAILAHSDASVLPSFREGLSNTLLEAMAARLPVVASAVGGTPEVINHGENGLLFQSDKDADLSQHLVQLYQNKALAERLANSAHQDIENKFSTQAMIDKMQSIYLAV